MSITAIDWPQFSGTAEWATRTISNLPPGVTKIRFRFRPGCVASVFLKSDFGVQWFLLKKVDNHLELWKEVGSNITKRKFA